LLKASKARNPAEKIKLVVIDHLQVKELEKTCIDKISSMSILMVVGFPTSIFKKQT
jgi:hypothetical protein